jgi:hypothetical protein
MLDNKYSSPRNIGPFCYTSNNLNQQFISLAFPVAYNHIHCAVIY